MAFIATSDSDQFWAENIQKLSRQGVEALVKEMRATQSNTQAQQPTFFQTENNHINHEYVKMGQMRNGDYGREGASGKEKTQTFESTAGGGFDMQNTKIDEKANISSGGSLIGSEFDIQNRQSAASEIQSDRFKLLRILLDSTLEKRLLILQQELSRQQGARRHDR